MQGHINHHNHFAQWAGIRLDIWTLCFDTLVIAVQLTITFESPTHAQISKV